ncbi:DNA repair protein RecO [Spiribacter vilamensis]|uniref:DNA repair protein RecO n=1 Tax=Spiribacter vilamensis TaxID=531306 RepID=A0A4Q8CZ06_9GAMM|nr:DNA repair protein RecO [Spiribacter vilamensis]RZU98192.1 DNA replication and repair protein RecO [Spiribacter vilamensis]TVO60907.1 DNA repair protein RecO [Spiribacter vilamensis]
MTIHSRDASLEPGFILHTRAYRDTSLLLEVLSRSHGRVGLVARGARGRKSRTTGLLQPFQPLALSWRSRGEMGSLREVEPAGRPFALKGRRLVSGLYANELLMRLLGREDPHPGLFEHYLNLLEALAEAVPEAVVLRGFERDLLGLLGYGLPLARDTEDAPLEPTRWYRYDPVRGAMPVAGPETTGLVVSGETLLGLAEPVMTESTARASRDLMRAALHPHIGHRPLKTRELYGRYTARRDSDHGPPSRQS